MTDPRAAGASVVPAYAPPARPLPGAPAARILVVESDRGVATELGARLAALGHAVVATAASGPEAIALAEQASPQLVLMEVALDGGMDGIAAAREIRRGWRIPTLFTVDESDDASLRRVATSGSCGHLLKPFAERELRVAVATALAVGAASGAAAEFEERFFDVSIDMLCCLDFNGYFARLNPAWERTLGYTREELMSQRFIEFVHPDDRERTLNQNREVRGGGQARSFENRYRCKDGSYRWLLWNAAPDTAQHVIYSVARDVTDRKLAEQEREQLVQQLRSALDEVRTLREILSICSYCKKIRDDEDYWESVESYISRHTTTRFSHGICPTCFDQVVGPQLDALEES